MGCECRCGGTYSLKGKSTPNGFVGQMKITKLTTNQAGNVTFTKTSGTAGIIIDPGTAVINASGIITTPVSGEIIIRGNGGATDPIPDGCAVFEVIYDCTGDPCPCKGYIKVKMNNPTDGDVSLEFLNEEPTACP